MPVFPAIVISRNSSSYFKDFYTLIENTSDRDSSGWLVHVPDPHTHQYLELSQTVHAHVKILVDHNIPNGANSIFCPDFAEHLADPETSLPEATLTCPVPFLDNTTAQDIVKRLPGMTEGDPLFMVLTKYLTHINDARRTAIETSWCHRKPDGTPIRIFRLPKESEASRNSLLAWARAVELLRSRSPGFPWA